MIKAFKKLALIMTFLVVIAACVGCSLTNKQIKPKVYLVGIDPTWYPLNLRGKDKNLEAFIKELLKDVSTHTGIRLQFIERPWDNLIEGLEKKQYDMVIGTLMPRDYYESKFFFSPSIFSTGPVLVVRKNFKVKDGMKGKVLAVGSAYQETLAVKNFPGATLRNYTEVPRALSDVMMENIDGALVNTLLAHAYVYDFYSSQLKIDSKALGIEGVRLICRLNSCEEEVKALAEGVEKAHSSGIYHQLLGKWGLLPGRGA